MSPGLRLSSDSAYPNPSACSILEASPRYSYPLTPPTLSAQSQNLNNDAATQDKHERFNNEKMRNMMDRVTLTPPGRLKPDVTTPSTRTISPSTKTPIASSKKKKTMAPKPVIKLVKIHHALAVNYPSVNGINSHRFDLSPKNWKLFDEEAQELFKQMSDECKVFRAAVEDQAPYIGDNARDTGKYYENIAITLRDIMMNKCWWIEPTRDQRKGAKALDWVKKRQEDLMPFCEAFTTTLGNPGAPLEIFTDHGYTPFLAARLRFLAAYERVYYAETPPSSPQNRKIRRSESWFAYYDKIQAYYQASHSQEHGQGAAYFTYPLLDKKWKHHHPTRGYNWHIPLAASTDDLMYNQIVMISHGINLLSYTTTYGSGRPIELEDPTIQLIEKTLQLCISAIDRYYRLFLALPKEGKFDPEEKDGRGKLEWEWQKGYIKDNMSVCLVIERDLARARGTLETMPKLNPNMPQTILESSDAQLVEGSLNNAANHQARILQSQICPIVQPQMNFTRQAETQNAYNEAQPEALEQFARVVASEKDATMSAEETSGTPTTTPAAAAAEDDQEGQEEEDVGALPMLGSNVLALLEAQVRRLEQSQRGGDGEEGEAEQDGDGEEREEEEEENGIPEQNTALPPISTNDANEGISSSGPEKVDLIVVSRRGSDAGVTNDGGGGNGEKGKDPSTFDVEDIVMEGLR